MHYIHFVVQEEYIVQEFRRYTQDVTIVLKCQNYS